MTSASTASPTRSSPVWAALAATAWLGAPAGAGGAEAVEPTPIRFAPGASSAVVRGAVVRGERAFYALQARAGQRLTLRLDAVEDNAAFQLYAPDARPRVQDSAVEVDGRALPGAGEGDDAARWTGTLPRSGAYLLVVGPTRGNAAYRLTVTIR